jgi:hypothetical protein
MTTTLELESKVEILVNNSKTISIELPGDPKYLDTLELELSDASTAVVVVDTLVTSVNN